MSCCCVCLLLWLWSSLDQAEHPQQDCCVTDMVLLSASGGSWAFIVVYQPSGYEIEFIFLDDCWGWSSTLIYWVFEFLLDFVSHLSGF